MRIGILERLRLWSKPSLRPNRIRIAKTIRRMSAPIISVIISTGVEKNNPEKGNGSGVPYRMLPYRMLRYRYQGPEKADRRNDQIDQRNERNQRNDIKSHG
jgi:hypothetical protein